eukprot:4336714-Prymnesium_polylepis.1
MQGGVCSERIVLRCGDQTTTLRSRAAGLSSFLRILRETAASTGEHELCVPREAFEHVCCVASLLEMLSATPGRFKFWADMDESERCAAKEIRFDQQTWDAADATSSPLSLIHI